MIIRNLISLLVLLLTKICKNTSESTFLQFCPSQCTCKEYYIPCLNNCLITSYKPFVKTLCSNSSLVNIPQNLDSGTDILDLSFNSISSITNSSFLKQNIISVLFLNNNELSTLEDEEIFRYLVKLRSLYINNNKLTKIHPNIFRYNQLLEEIDLQNNEISLKDAGPFIDMKSLRKLNLTSCNISRISEEFFKGTTNIVKLDISNNKIQYIHDRAFQNFNKLKFLNLSGNRIKSLNFKIFMPDNTLQMMELDISNNNINTNNNNNNNNNNNITINKIIHEKLSISNKEIEATEIASNEKRVTKVFKSSLTIGHKRNNSYQNYSTSHSDLKDMLSYSSSNNKSKSSSGNDESYDISKTEVVIISVSLFVTLVILILVVITYFFVKSKLSKLDLKMNEYDSVPLETMTAFQSIPTQLTMNTCSKCQLYQNLTCKCKCNSVLTQSHDCNNIEEEHGLQFATVQSVDMLESLYYVESVGSSLYIPLNEANWSDNENDLNKTSNTRMNVSPINSKSMSSDNLSIKNIDSRKCKAYNPEFEKHNMTLPRINWREKQLESKAVSSSTSRSKGTDLIHNYRHSCIEYPSTSWIRTGSSPPVPRRLESLIKKLQKRPLPPSPTGSHRVTETMSLKNVPESRLSNIEHFYEEIT